ncbi:MAG: serine/threonine-protein kinase [Anaeromyxobacteraceae bacterium]
MAVSHPQQPRVREGDRIGTVPDGMIGRVLGDRYRVLSRLGEGGMGTVYLCEHAVLRRRFALKVLRPELGDDPELVERFRNEAIAASRIGQENVVDVVDFGAEEDGALYYVMEALDGRSVGAILRDEGPFAVSRTLSLLEQTCRALAAAHARGVVHRDVKPENVFVVRREEAERVKILDFGISHVPAEMTGSKITRAGSIIGTPEYMAPEQANGEPIDHRADVYAVGVLAYEMLTGLLPFEANGPVATLVAAREQPVEPPSRKRKDIPVEVDRIVVRALAKKPDDRFPSMLDFAAELLRVRAGIFGAGSTPDPVRGQSPTMRYEPAPRKSRPRSGTLAVGEPTPELSGGRPTLPRGLRGLTRRRTAIAAGAVLLLLAIVGGTYAWLRQPPAPAAVAAAPAPATPPPAAPTPAGPEPVAAAQPAPAPPVELIPPAAPVAAPVEERVQVPSVLARPAPRKAVQKAAAPPKKKPSAEEPIQDPYGDDLKPNPFK